MKLLVAEFHHLGDGVLALPFVRGALGAGHEVEVWCRPPVKPIFEMVEAGEEGRARLRVECWEPPWHEETRREGGLLGKLRAYGGRLKMMLLAGERFLACPEGLSPARGITGDKPRLRKPSGSGQLLAPSRKSSFLDVSYGELIGRWRGAGFDAAVCVWADARVQGLFAAAGIRERVGFPMNARNYYGSRVPWRRRTLAAGRVLEVLLSLVLRRRLLTRALEREDERQHHLEAWGQVAEALGFRLRKEVPWLAPGEVLEEEVREVLREVKGRRTLFVHPGGRLACKTWPRERYEAVLGELGRRLPEVAVVVCEAPGERAPRTAGRWQRVVRTRTVRDLCAVIGACDVYLGNDSLGAHLAAAMGKPGVVIFGSSDERIFAPGGRAEMVLRAEGACFLHPCMDRCRMGSVVCLEAVAVEAVVGRVVKILEDFS